MVCFFNKDREKTTIYLPKVPENVDRKMLHEVFQQVGPIAHIDHVIHKKMAFVTFKSPEAASKAIGQTFVLHGENIIPERRKYSNPNPKKYENYRSGGAGYQARGGQKNGNFKQTKKDKPANA
jgi:hypothetical protein